MSRIYDIANEYVDVYAALNPIVATSISVPGYERELPDYSPTGDEARTALARDTVEALDAAEAEGDRDRVARETMAERLRLQLELHDAGEHFRSINILGSPVQSLRRVFDLMPRESTDDWANIAARMQRVPEALNGYRRTLQVGVERGFVGARRQVQDCAQQAQIWATGGEGVEGFFGGLVPSFEHSDIDNEALAVELRDASVVAADGYTEFGRFLAEEYAPSADERDGVGDERYLRSARAYNGIELDLDETYSWGWDELHRVEAEMASVTERIQPGAGVEAVKELLETDPGRSIEGVEPFREWMQSLQDRTIAALHGTHFDIPEPVRRIEALIAPPGGALAMYYTGPSEDFSRPGRTWYPTGGKTRFPLWGEVSIAYHEGVPGHHLQIGQVTFLAESLSRYQRLLGGTSGYVEGWALYAERLMQELGYLDVPDNELGMLRAQALRCARVVVDIGMHLGLTIPESDGFHPGETWTPELGLEFMRLRSHFPEDFIASEVTRYLGLPGQAISYKVGERAWLQARDGAQERAGADFSLKTFHARALDLGPMGLEQMQRELATL